MRQMILLIILCSCMAIFGFPCSAFAMEVTQPAFNRCDVSQLPVEIQNRIKTDFGTWRAQRPENLSHQARLTWAGRKNSGCPGIAMGFFQNPKQSSYAILLVPSDNPDAAYRFVVFNRRTDNSAYEELVVEKSDVRGASNFFIQTAPVSKFFDEPSKKEFEVQVADAILMVDSAENEYEADIYFWSKDRFRQEPVDY
jgi:hypothetical protein